jgi:hypothetical protein
VREVDGGNDDAEGSKSAVSPTQNPVSELWLPYYAAAQREAEGRATERVRREQSVHLLTRVIWALALSGAVALFVFLR